MKCYYEELAIERDASESEIKTAYRKLALKWHPDKNLDSLEVAKERFQLIQQAYEVLSDPQERAWYDNHREQILRGKNSDYEDNCLDVFQYFTVSCFKGYGDDAKGFYAVYREVFEKLAAEDAEFMDDEEDLENIPKFGDSKSNYEDVVGPFYAYWSAYCTKRTYTWLCPYDIKDIKDRRILREIEKDMKKVVQKAKKERNEEVRNLVSFIRKRDKRVLAYKKVLEERAAFNRQKQEQNRLEQIRRRQQELEEMRQNSKTAAAHNDDYEEQLKQLEQQYSSDEEYYEEDIEDEDEDADIENQNLAVDNTLESLDNDVEEEDEEDYIDDLYCVACNREFKTAKAFANHESSKKHRDNIEKLKLEMQQEEESFQKEDNLDEEDLELVLTDDDEIDALPEELVSTKTKSRKNKNKKETKKSKLLTNSDEDLTATEEKEEELIKPLAKLDLSDNDDKDGNDDWNSSKKSNKKSKNKTKTTKNKTNLPEATTTKPMEAKAEPRITVKQNSIPQSCDLEADNTEHVCVTCKSKFVSKNKLFSHLKLTNHGVYIPKAKPSNDDCGKSKKTKGKKK